MKSMTAYGESSVNTEIGKVLVEIRSENHRFLDLKTQICDTLCTLENQASDLLSNEVIRGKLRLKISLSENANVLSVKNEKIFKQNYKILEKAKKEIGLQDDIKIEHVLFVKDFLNIEPTIEIPNGTEIKVLNTIKKALKKFNSNRKIEGKKLKKDILSRMKLIKNYLREIKKKRKEFTRESTAKIYDRVQNILEEVQIDQEKLIQEVAFLTERSDISEELVRLDAHITKFDQTTNSTDSIGKELDFLILEMNRECGTISAKCKDAGISHLTISIRSELEKIREQVQNIE